MDAAYRRYLERWRRAVFGEHADEVAPPVPKPGPQPEKLDPLVAARIRANIVDMRDANIITVDDYGVITGYNDSMQERYETNAHFVDDPYLAGHGPVTV